jgi:hypothetical protein
MKKTVTLGLSTKTSIKSRLFRSWPLWVGAVALLGAVGWLTYSSVEKSASSRLADTLQLIVETETKALRLWLETQEATAQAFATDQTLQEAVVSLRGIVGSQEDFVQALQQAPEQEELREHLGDNADALGYQSYVLIEPDGIVLSSTRPGMVGSRRDLGDANPRTQQWHWQIVRTLAGATTISQPFAANMQFRDGSGQVSKGLPVMHVFAPVKDDNGKVLAALGFRIDPKSDFTEMLRIARLWESGESYAFSREGLMLSQSRFDDQLKSIGLLGEEPSIDSILSIQIRDPEGDLTRGFKPRKDRETQPLTWAVANATAGREMVDVEGYRDYRGVEVVGAWKWLEKYDFGVAFEVDYDEAYAGVKMLRLAFGVVFGLLTLATLGVLGETLVISKLRSKVSRAQSKLQQLGQYTLIEKLGEGGMGEVYKARHTMLRRPTAIKLLKPDKTNADMVARFEREVQLTSQLTHPNTIAIYDYGKTPEGIFYYAMEHLDGITLEELVKLYGPISTARARFILLQACASLQEAHDVGLIHRDVKPANMFLCIRGGQPDFVKILDFGLVRAYGAEADMTKLTQDGTTTGTPAYMAPEMILGQKIGPQADIYALGCVAYWLLTGQLLFDVDTPMSMAMAHTKDEPVPPSLRTEVQIPAQFETVILSCLAKRSADRPQSAEQLAKNLRECDLDIEWGKVQAKEWWNRHQPSSQNNEKPPNSV